MAKVTLSDVAASQLSTQNALNNNFQSIEDELNNDVLYRNNPDGEANQMENSLDMNSNRIINVGAPVAQSDAVRLADITSDIGSTTASLVEVEDSAGNYVGENVEAVLAEAHDELADLSGIEDATTARSNLDIDANMDNRGFAQQVEDVTTLRAAIFNSTLDRIWLSGYYGAGTAGGGALYRDPADMSSADNSGTIFVDADGVRWKREEAAESDWKLVWFGVQGDGTDETSLVQNAIDTTPVGNTLWFPNKVVKVSTLTNDDQITIRGTGWQFLVGRPEFGNVSYDSDANFNGSVLRFTDTTSTAFRFGVNSGDVEPGSGFSDIMFVGPGSGTGVGVNIERLIEAHISNIAVVNFSTGWKPNGGNNEVRVAGLHIWGCEQALHHAVSDNNDFLYHGLYMQNNTSCILIEDGEGNVFSDVLMQSYDVNGIVIDTTTSTGTVKYNRFRDLWIENSGTADPTGDWLKIDGDNIQFVEIEHANLTFPGSISLTGGTNNDSHLFRRWVANNFDAGQGHDVLNIPSGMSNCRVEDVDGFSVVDVTGLTWVSGGQFSQASVTLTLTGVSTTETGDAFFHREGKLVTVQMPTINGTSDTTAMTLTGVPQNFTPSATSSWHVCRIQDNGTTAFGIARVTSAGVIDFRVNAAGAVFTGSGTKGVSDSTISYIT